MPQPLHNHQHLLPFSDLLRRLVHSLLSVPLQSSPLWEFVQLFLFYYYHSMTTLVYRCTTDLFIIIGWGWVLALIALLYRRRKRNDYKSFCSMNRMKNHYRPKIGLWRK